MTTDENVKSEFLFEETKRELLRLSLLFFPREVQFALILQFFLHEICLIIFWREILKKTLLKFLPKMLLVETLCKLVQIFPPKVLVYIRKIFLTAFLTNVVNL